MNLRDKVVLVTGGTGSFGKKFVEMVLRDSPPKRLVVFSRDELKQSEMQPKFPGITYFLGDVRDRDRLERAFRGVDVVIHAAALKQVPACEYNPFEAVKTNVLGAQNIIDAAINNGVQRVVALSTDKACNPINLYGATKLCSDKLFVAGNSYAGAGPTRFAVVRYGNVIGSRGSVVPLFREQAKKGVLTITDKRMTRFWITLEQGVHFVLASLERMRGGEIFVPKIPSMAIAELARLMAPDAKIDVVGIRPGEKLHEMLIPVDEARDTLEFDDHYVIQPRFPWWGGTSRQGGVAVSETFSYASDSNPQQLSPEDLRKVLASS